MMGLLSCREVARRLSEERDDPNPSARRLRMRVHLLVCAACRRYGRQLTWLSDNVQRTVNRRMPAERRERVRQALRDHLDV